MAEEDEFVDPEGVQELLQRGGVRADLLEQLHPFGERLQTEAAVQFHQPPGERRRNRSGDYYDISMRFVSPDRDLNSRRHRFRSCLFHRKKAESRSSPAMSGQRDPLCTL